jgi:hypothetical protein
VRLNHLNPTPMISAPDRLSLVIPADMSVRISPAQTWIGWSGSAVRMWPSATGTHLYTRKSTGVCPRAPFRTRSFVSGGRALRRARLPSSVCLSAPPSVCPLGTKEDAGSPRSVCQLNLAVCVWHHGRGFCLPQPVRLVVSLSICLAPRRRPTASLLASLGG